MGYEELRKQYIEYLSMGARLGRLKRRAKAGGLSPDRLAACKQEIDRLDKESSRLSAEFQALEDAGDPAWTKLSRELDFAMTEYTKHGDEEPVGFLSQAKRVVGAVSLLILGTWMIDSWRRK